MSGKFTVLTLIKDEPYRIIPLLENFKGIAEVVVLLDPLDTLTEPILIERSVKYIKRPSNYNEITQPERTKWILDQSPTPYVLMVMASFYVPITLLKIFSDVASNNIYNGVIHSTVSYSHGVLVQEPWIRKRASACYFFRRDNINLSTAITHDEFPIDRTSNFFKAPPVRDCSIQVFRDDDMSILTLKEVRYAESEALERLSMSNNKVTLFSLAYKTLKSFLLGYVRMGGFRSGVEGLIYHIQHAIQQFLVYSRLWELQNKKGFHENRLCHVKMRLKLIENDRQAKS